MQGRGAFGAAAILLLWPAIPGAAAVPDDHVQLRGELGWYCGPGTNPAAEVVVTVDRKPLGGYVASLVALDPCWALLHALALSANTIAFQLQGSWEEGLHGRAITTTCGYMVLSIGPYGEGRAISVTGGNWGILTACEMMWWGTLPDAQLV